MRKTRVALIQPGKVGKQTAQGDEMNKCYHLQPNPSFTNFAECIKAPDICLPS